MIFRHILACSALLCIGAGWISTVAHAQALNFGENTKEGDIFLLEQYFKSNPALYETASIDLNQDGISELIVRSSCTEGTACDYSILANRDDQPLELGTIKALRLAPAQSFSYGVRDLEAYQNPNNDFAYNIYAWDWTSSRYKIKE